MNSHYTIYFNGDQLLRVGAVHLTSINPYADFLRWLHTNDMQKSGQYILVCGNKAWSYVVRVTTEIKISY